MKSSASQREVCFIDGNNPEGYHSGAVISTPHSKRVGFDSMTGPFCLKFACSPCVYEGSVRVL